MEPMTGKQLRALRRELELSQKEVARAISMNHMVVSVMELDTVAVARERTTAYLLAEKAKREASSPQAA